MSKWILIASAFIIGIFGFIAYIFIKIRIKKMRNEYTEELDKAEAILNKSKEANNYPEDVKSDIHKNVGGIENAILRNDLGELLWDFDAELINKKIKHLAFIDMEFLISTIFRNKYESFLQISSVCGYEIITIASKSKMNLYYENIENMDLYNEYIKKFDISSENIKPFDRNIKYDIILIAGTDKDIIEKIVRMYKLLNKNGLIFISGLMNRKNKKYSKDLKKYLKLVDYRFEENKICKNIMLIAK